MARVRHVVPVINPMALMQQAFIGAAIDTTRRNMRFTRDIMDAASLSVEELCNELALPPHCGQSIERDQNEMLGSFFSRW